MFYVESHVADADLRGGGINTPSDSIIGGDTGIVDAGFILTAPLHRVLSSHREWNDSLALMNSLFLLIPNIYLAHATMWRGDYTLSFRLLATQLFRSFCGWFTYLPPDKYFLVSYYDFPEILQCLSRNCSLAANDMRQQEVLPFVSFFSGHVATVAIVANHMYLNGFIWWSLGMHVCNWLQIIRLLATRGHYSIDIIIGWCVAVYVSNPAERLGRYYSRGMSFRELVTQGGAIDIYERVTGVQDIKLGSRLSCCGPVKGGEWHDEDNFQSDTAARILAETASEFAARSLQDLQNELNRVGLHMQDLIKLRRNEISVLAELAQLRMSELRAEARCFDENIGTDVEGMSRKDILELIMGRIRKAVERTSWIEAEITPELASRGLAELRAELSKIGLRAHEMQELRHNDLICLLALARLKIGELRAEARLLGVKISEGMSQLEILVKIISQMKNILLNILKGTCTRK